MPSVFGRPILMFKLPSRLSERTAPQPTCNLNIAVQPLHELQHSGVNLGTYAILFKAGQIAADLFELGL